MTLGILLDSGPYYPELLSSACYVAPVIAIICGWLLVRRGHSKLALLIAAASAIVVAARVPVALSHLQYYQDKKEWVIVGFAALFPFYCVLRYMVGRNQEPNQRPENNARDVT